MATFKILEGTELIRALYSGELAGLNFGLPAGCWDMLAVARLGCQMDESFYVSKQFREIMNAPAGREQSLQLYIKGDEARFVRRLETKDAGVIPTLYLGLDYLAAHMDDLLRNSVDFFEGSDIQVRGERYFTYQIPDLQNYDIPRNIKRQVALAEKAQHIFSVYPVTDDEMYQFASEEPTSANDAYGTWIASIVQSRLYFAGIHPTDDVESRQYEEIFSDYHNIPNMLLRDSLIHSSETNQKFAVGVNGHIFGSIDVSVSKDQDGNESWHWCNTYRLRYGFNLSAMESYNVNTVILAQLIETAKLSGVQVFDLGQGIGYDYKKRFKPVEKWTTGLVYRK